ncbi:hypothetical protein FT663_04588 [Candidozyma haemuli var. vulneris]|uniref:Uncharacterized protein n=1 Tax=Candidozyma haemuli TaxID=45357 RepID=A0A2V1ALT5_9ASCO|nr:hypothetical protein CXQ85_000955 [[Candida] haemuloni]KAF3986309.1 hypothetical protein FT662_04640 [[Candida] haemuloni var. vulneris]KAF3987121.1 hypothetical protein FT663_04588 [[Candida] haemuloni var. vulneris]PVH18672.1 hypothetical protein CXQ85_000955 [[Candida] haemuloni]
MPVEHGKPHAADIPVRDLDDPEDDLFDEDRNDSQFLDPLDYENSDQGLRSQPPTRFWGKIQEYFNGPNSWKPGSYEMVDTSGTSPDSFEISDGDGDSNDTLSDEDAMNQKLREIKIARLRKMVNWGVLAFSFLLFFMWLTYAFFRSGGKKSDEEPSTFDNKNKRVLSNSTHDFYPTTILVSLDGFHPHYISPQRTPALHNMMVNDYGAPYMTPAFPSSTFPNHWTLITGLYPSEHGIVGNTFYDPKLKKQFVNTDPVKGLDADFWKGGEAIWTTTFKQGVKSAVHMWPGSEVPGIGENGPMEVDKFNGTELLTSKIDRVMGWIDREDIHKRPELLLTYVPTIDQYGHKFGISGPELTDALKYVDDFITLMIQEIKSRNLEDIVNLVVVSDHGMAPTSNDRLLFLDDVVDLSKLAHIDGWPLFGLRPTEEFTVDQIYDEIKEKFEKLDEKTKKGFNYYKVEDLPKEWNFGGNDKDHAFNYRLAPIWIVPNVGYGITTRQKFKEKGENYTPKGVHGYNNTELLMRAIFLGRGPYFKKQLADNKKVLPFDNTNVYNIICESLDVKPSPNNGTSADSFVISQNKLLPPDWNDNLIYPDLPYEVDHLVKDATYDLLWRKPSGRTKVTTISLSTNKDPQSSLSSEDSMLKDFSTETLPRPSDFEHSTTDTDSESEETSETEHSDDDSDSSDSDKESSGKGDDDQSALDGFIDDVSDLVDDVVGTIGNGVDSVLNYFGGG